MGGCCAPCDEGLPCASTLRALALVPRARGRVGFVTDTDIDALNDGINQLEIDVNAAMAKADTHAPTFGRLFALEADVVALAASWAEYVADHTGTLSRFSDDAFAEFKLRYSRDLAELRALNIPTTAKDIGPGSNPGDKGKPLLEQLGVPTWLVVAAIGLALLVVVGPAVVQVLAVRRLAP